MKHILVVTALFFGQLSHAEPEPREVEFGQALKDLQCPMRLLCIAAHPDDEDGATLAYYRYKYGVETHVAIATRGEGGQNEIGPELYEELAAIRTEEMKAAAEIEGAKLHILNLPDFGFSKTLEETQEVWGKEETLRRVVRLIREVRPHVIITHHGRMKDHGHHQAIGAATIEAFEKAADPAFDPATSDDECEQELHRPWQASRLFIRDFEDTGDVTVPLYESDERLGKTYAEVAADALRAHKSQGMEFFIERLLSGKPEAKYDLYREAKGTDEGSSSGDQPVFNSDEQGDESNLFAGIETPLRTTVRVCNQQFPASNMEVKRLFSPSPELSKNSAAANIHLPAGVRVGLISAYDTTLKQTLETLGIQHGIIGDNKILAEQLVNYTTVIIDMRAYQYRKDLVEKNAELLAWCKRGGTLIVMYQKTFDWREEFAPYPLRISRNRVTREDSTVKHRVPEHPFFHVPNEIMPADWDGWIQERGLYYADQWDDAYTPLLEITDPGEQIPPGSLLVAEYGEGTYVYTALVWYRQLRELHPGALRLFCNLLAL